MSIIHDALKKVQNSKSASAGPDSPVSGAPDPSLATSRSAGIHPGDHPPVIPRKVLIALMVLTSVVVLAILLILIGLAKQTTLHPKIVLEEPPVTVSVAVPGQATSVQEPLRLEGIMNMGAKKVALINGNIYEEGQAVEGMTVIKVTDTNVTVQANGVERVLKIHR